MNLAAFIHQLKWADLPGDVQHQARRCLLDTLGAGIGGRQTALSEIVFDFADTAFQGRGAFLWLDGREVSPPGAALANGMTIDALDIHDGYTLVKGHAGAALVPATLATLKSQPKVTISGQELLATLVMGYEVALRAGLALHQTACDYHTSGAWNALGCAAITARRLGLSAEQTSHALGIAEYHGPRSPMMRCIDHPTMLKDGSGWGAMAGVSAGMLAGAGFTGAPALTIEGSEVGDIWADLGVRWLILDQYFKPQAVCRWAQPAVEGALKIQNRHPFSAEKVQRLRVFTFHEATRLACRRPQTTEEAQYSLPYPVAAALVFGRLGPAELSGEALKNAQVLGLSDKIELIEDPALNARFPAERFARVKIYLADGTILDSGLVEANWDATAPPSDEELGAKFRWLAGNALPADQATTIEKTVWDCDKLDDMQALLSLLGAVDARL